VFLPVFHSAVQRISLFLEGSYKDLHHSIEIENLSFTYPDGRKALDKVSLYIAPCEKVALVGPNGAGKSTLILHLNGILRGEGSIRSASLELKKENLALIRARIGLVFQSPEDQLFSPTVYDDVAYGPIYMGLSQDEVNERVHHALTEVGMAGYENRISHHLSLGEKKRIAIASVLSMQPEVLVLDEPTSGLDPRARRSLIELLDKLNLTMLVSTHDMLMVNELLPRTIVLDEGRIVADGPTQALMSDEALLSAHGLEMPYPPRDNIRSV
jgi:cobalt/nickel transport system ATP-binding protein